MEIFLICFVIIGVALFFGFKKNKKETPLSSVKKVQSNDRNEFNQNYARQFRALGRKKIKTQKNLENFTLKWLRKKKKETLIS